MQLTKHHGLGNDFLVMLDPGGLRPVSALAVRHACDRHRGIGADGFIRATAGEGDAHLTMNLFNADGGRAEMSGNGIGCMVQAAVLAGLVAPPTVAVRTDAGRRLVQIAPNGERSHRVTTDMGPAKVGEEEPEWVDDDIIRAVRVDVGNPHVVLHALDPDLAADVTELGRVINDSTPGGINVELIAPGPGAGELTMRVYERGVGRTEACGTGACAAAAAAVAWELTGPEVIVHQPGGDARVTVGDTAILEVEVHHVATVDLPWP